MSTDPDVRVCENCGRWVDEKETLYHVRMEVYAEPSIKDLDPGEDPEEARREWEDFLRELEEMSDDQVEDANAQVHEEFRFFLCPKCRSELHKRIRRRRQILEGF